MVESMVAERKTAGRWRAMCIQMPSRTARGASSRREAWGIIAANLHSATRMIKQAMDADPPPALVVLPEFAFQGPPKGESVTEWLDKACYPVPGPITEPLQELARSLGLYIGGNQFESDPEWTDRFFNTSFLIDPDGRVVLRYRRIHTAQWVSPHDFLDDYLARYGMEGLWPVVETSLGRVAMLACGEIMVPEASRMLMLRGAEILVHPTNEPVSEAEGAGKVSAAAANMMYVVSANVAGPIGFSDGDPPVTGGWSRIVDFRGATLSLEDSPTETVGVSAILDTAALRATRSENSMANGLLRIRIDSFRDMYRDVVLYPANSFLDSPMKHWQDTSVPAAQSLQNLGALGVIAPVSD